MSNYVSLEGQAAFDPDFDFAQYIDPALLSLHASDANQETVPAAQGLRPFEAGQSGIEAAILHACTSTELSPSASSICTRALSTSGNTTESSCALERKRTVILECVFPGCDHEGKFARKFELKRHINSKHGAVRTYTCGALGCFKRGNTRWTFSRLDKLTDHIRAVHAHNTPFSGCPVDDCRFGPSCLDVLGAHIQRAHPHCQKEARSITNVTTAKRRRCPLSGCNNKIFSLDSFLMHLGGHEAEDLRVASSNLCFEGLTFDFPTVVATDNDAVTGFRIGIACPACPDTSPTFEHFQMHLWTSHLFLDSMDGVEHFLAWKYALTCVSDSLSGTLPWDNSLLDQRQIVKCPRCMHSIMGANAKYGVPEVVEAQHPGLMKSSEQVTLELGPVRMQILRLYPEFLTHPIFDDCV